jgi:hypothetical protein
MGKGWSEARNSKGTRRLDDPNDFVRVELEKALARGVRVIPVLVDGAAMPSSDELPQALRPLVRRHAVEVSHPRFGSDVQRLVDALAPIVAPVDNSPSAKLSGKTRRSCGQGGWPAIPSCCGRGTASRTFDRLCRVSRIQLTDKSGDSGDSRTAQLLDRRIGDLRGILSVAGRRLFPAKGEHTL